MATLAPPRADPDTTEATLHALRRAWNAHDASAVARCYRGDGAKHMYGPIPRVHLGRDDIADDVTRLIALMPDLTVHLRAWETLGLRTLVEWLMAGTLSTDDAGLGTRDAMVSISGASVMQMDVGLIAEERCYWVVS